MCLKNGGFWNRANTEFKCQSEHLCSEKWRVQSAKRSTHQLVREYASWVSRPGESHPWVLAARPKPPTALLQRMKYAPFQTNFCDCSDPKLNLGTLNSRFNP